MPLDNESRGMIEDQLRQGNIDNAFDFIEGRYTKEFDYGKEGWELYKECSALVRANAPAHLEEFQKRFAQLPDIEAMTQDIPSAPKTVERVKKEEIREHNAVWWRRLLGF